MDKDKETETLESELAIVDENNVIKLSKPLANGNDSIVFDFDRINGYTLLKCGKLAKKEDKTIVVLETSKVYQAYVAAAASGLKYDDILSLGARDFTAVCLGVQNFLLDAYQ